MSWGNLGEQAKKGGKSKSCWASLTVRFTDMYPLVPRLWLSETFLKVNVKQRFCKIEFVRAKFPALSIKMRNLLLVWPSSRLKNVWIQNQVERNWTFLYLQSSFHIFFFHLISTASFTNVDFSSSAGEKKNFPNRNGIKNWYFYWIIPHCLKVQRNKKNSIVISLNLRYAEINAGMCEICFGYLNEFSAE